MTMLHDFLKEVVIAMLMAAWHYFLASFFAKTIAVSVVTAGLWWGCSGFRPLRLTNGPSTARFGRRPILAKSIPLLGVIFFFYLVSKATWSFSGHLDGDKDKACQALVLALPLQIAIPQSPQKATIIEALGATMSDQNGNYKLPTRIGEFLKFETKEKDGLLHYSNSRAQRGIFFSSGNSDPIYWMHIIYRGVAIPQFTPDDDTIPPSGGGALEQLATQCKNQGLHCVVVGFADQCGNEFDNLRLGKRRAAACIPFLKAGGVPVDHIITASLGANAPVYGEWEKYCYNRRVMVLFIPNPWAEAIQEDPPPNATPASITPPPTPTPISRLKPKPGQNLNQQMHRSAPAKPTTPKAAPTAVPPWGQHPIVK